MLYLHKVGVPGRSGYATTGALAFTAVVAAAAVRGWGATTRVVVVAEEGTVESVEDVDGSMVADADAGAGAGVCAMTGAGAGDAGAAAPLACPAGPSPRPLLRMALPRPLPRPPGPNVLAF